MTRRTPPQWLERALLLLVPARDRETISGDLLEEYREEQLPRSGRLQADVWYLRQCVSFASIRLWGGPRLKQVLVFVCLFVTAASVWLAVMENVLKHAGYAGRAVIAGSLAAQAVVTLLYLLLNGRSIFRGLVLTIACSILLFGVWVVVSILRAEHFEGYLLVIGAASILQGTLAIPVLLRVPAGKTA